MSFLFKEEQNNFNVNLHIKIEFTLFRNYNESGCYPITSGGIDMENILINGYSHYTSSNNIQRSAIEERDLGDGRTSSISASVSYTVTWSAA